MYFLTLILPDLHSKKVFDSAQAGIFSDPQFWTRAFCLQKIVMVFWRPLIYAKSEPKFEKHSSSFEVWNLHLNTPTLLINDHFFGNECDSVYIMPMPKIIFQCLPSNRASKLNAEVKLSSPRSSTRTIVLRMK